MEDLVTPIADAHPDRSFSMRIAPKVFAAVDRTEFGYVVANLTDNIVCALAQSRARRAAH